VRTAWIAALLRRELTTLRAELLAYDDEADLWRRQTGVANSAGNLALHVVGNLNHYVGARLGGTGYVRDREAEFTRTGVPRAEIVAAIDHTIPVVERTLAGIGDGDLDRPYPDRIAGCELVTGDFLTHLAVHLAYHLGQVDLHRRATTGGGAIPGAVAIGELASARRTDS
jgi:hypothetical protein